MVTIATKMEARKSMLDVLKDGLHSSGRSTFRHRVLYVGEHQLGRGLEDFMRGAVGEEGLAGFLLVYPHHFIHAIEGSESSITKHLRAVVQGAANGVGTGRMKVAIEIAHVSKRCFTAWGCRVATPPTLASRPKAGVADTAGHVDAVLGKTMRLVAALKKTGVGAALSQKMVLQLPEAELLQALLDAPLLPDVRQLLQDQRVPPRITLYDDEAWPMQSDFVPYHLLEEPISVPSEVHIGNAEERASGDDDKASDAV